jgi:hypothetical protein
MALAAGDSLRSRRGQASSRGLMRRVAPLAVYLGVAVSCGGTAPLVAPSPPVVTQPPPTGGVLPGVSVSVNAVDLGGRNVLAVADVQGAVATSFEWFFERRPLPDVTTTSNRASYVYDLPGFKDFTVRVTLVDGRRALGSGAVVVE